MDKISFVAKFGAVYEQSPWVAETVYGATGATLIGDSTALSICFKNIFLSANRQLQLGVLRAHPQLACSQAEMPALSADSQAEQSGAGLDQCSAKELLLFRELNDDYLDQHGFPFIIAVKGYSRQEILEIFRTRLNNDLETEFQTALGQVCKIGRLRIEAILRK